TAPAGGGIPPAERELLRGSVVTLLQQRAVQALHPHPPRPLDPGAHRLPAVRATPGAREGDGAPAPRAGPGQRPEGVGVHPPSLHPPSARTRCLATAGPVSAVEASVRACSAA